MSTLFSEFDKVSPAAWKQKIQVDLKGADYNETLLWTTEEGIVVKPVYTDLDRTNADIDLPEGAFDICQSVFVDDVNIANKLAVDALDRGATAIQFVADKEFDYKALLAGIDVSTTTLYCKLGFLSADFVTALSNHVNADKLYIQLDIFGNLARSGNWFHSEKEDLKSMGQILAQANNAIGIDVSLYQNAGANRVQQLAYALAVLNEYIESFGADRCKKIHFEFAVGANYFLEIGKLRAFRLLAKTLFDKHGTTAQTHLYCTPSKRNKTIYDYNVNMLRTTSECMSAVLGGANTVANLAYDAIYNKSNEFGERIARNQLLILQNESYLAQSQNIADGSYYIESITHQLAQKALEVFKQIEKAGGFVSQLKKGSIQSKIAESAQKEEQRLIDKDLVLLGTNRLPNDKDTMSGSMELYPFVKANPVKTVVPPIIEKRIAQKLEQERLKKESSHDRETGQN